MGLSDGKLLSNILRNVDGITLLFDVVTDLGSLDGSFDGYNYGKPERLLLGESLGSTDGKVLGSDEGIKLGSSEGKLFDTILWNFYGITLGIDDGSDLVSLDGSFEGSDDWKRWGYYLETH